MPTSSEPRDRSMVPQAGAPRNRLVWLGRKLLPVGLFLAAGVTLIVVVGVAQRIGWLPSASVNASAAGKPGAVYTCPMHPQIRQPGPGRCPIC